VPELSPTAKVILGVLRMRPSSGYEIKALVDKATSYFWRAGYGSIYPELKRLREAGLVEGTEADAGDRRRVLHRLTPAGERELERWLEGEPEGPELRDEGMLHLFFSESEADVARALEQMAAAHEEIASHLEEIEPAAKSLERPGPLVTLRLGLDNHRFARDWCRREAARLQGESAKGDGDE
jgi:PadR family transcriptional regulator, regulatory protein AphA